MKCNAYIEKRCQSCTYLNLDYSKSLLLKEADFFSLFDRSSVGEYQPIVAVQNALGSRNKAKLSVALVNNEIEFGIYDKDQSFSKLEDCPLHLSGINNMLTDLKLFFTKFNIIPYDLNSKKGEIKIVLITKSDTTNELMVRFVLRSKESLDRFKKLTIELQNLNPLIKLVSVNIQPEHKAVLEGLEEIVLSKSNFIEHNYNNFKIHLGVKSFFQVTSSIARKLYLTIGKFCSDNSIDSMLDLYCGVGAFSFYVSPYVKKITGVEISTDAINFARVTSKENKIENIDFRDQDVDKFLLTNTTYFQAVITNPPRRGVGFSGMNAIMKMAPQFIIYSSCNSKTLFSDVEILKAHYAVKSTQIFDMFPFSKHYEVLMILEKLI